MKNKKKVFDIGKNCNDSSLFLMKSDDLVDNDVFQLKLFNDTLLGWSRRVFGYTTDDFDDVYLQYCDGIIGSVIQKYNYSKQKSLRGLEYLDQWMYQGNIYRLLTCSRNNIVYHNKIASWSSNLVGIEHLVDVKYNTKYTFLIGNTFDSYGFNFGKYNSVAKLNQNKNVNQEHEIIFPMDDRYVIDVFYGTFDEFKKYVETIQLKAHPCNYPKRSMIEYIIDNINKSLEIEAYMAALSLALMLIDTCAKAEYPSDHNKERYIKWYNDYIGKYEKADFDDEINEESVEMPYLSGEMIYKVRCNVLHQSTPDILKSEIQEECNKLDSFTIVVQKRNKLEMYAGGCFSVEWDNNQNYTRSCRLNLRDFCNKIIAVCRKYYENNKEKFNFLTYRLLDWDEEMKFMKSIGYK